MKFSTTYRAGSQHFIFDMKNEKQNCFQILYMYIIDQNVCLLVDYSQEMKCKSNVSLHTTPGLTKTMCGAIFLQLTEKPGTFSTQEHIMGSLNCTTKAPIFISKGWTTQSLAITKIGWVGLVSFWQKERD